MRTQPRMPAPERTAQERNMPERNAPHRETEDDDVFTDAAPRRNGSVPTSTDRPDAASSTVPDAMQHSPLAVSSGPAPELDGQEELGPNLNWVSLDAPRGLLVCKNLDLEVTQFVGTLVESRVVRVMKDNDGTVFCASSNRSVADVGRPGRECATCEDRSESCFPRWWIAWQEEDSGQVFAHTLSQTGTLNFTRYVSKLERQGLKPSQTLTRLFVEEARRQKAGTVYRRLQFEQHDPFAD